MSRLNKAIAESVDAASDPDVMATEVLAGLGVPKKWADLFRPLLRDECRRQIRSAVVGDMVRQAMDDVRTARDHSRPAHQTSIAPGRPEFLAASVCCGGEIGYVALGSMTIEHHEARIAFQQSLRSGIDRDIQRHREFIDRIRSTPGATCLDDVYDVEDGAA